MLKQVCLSLAFSFNHFTAAVSAVLKIYYALPIFFLQMKSHISSNKRPGCLFKISAKGRGAYWKEGS